jgi:hypothetical protein
MKTSILLIISLMLIGMVGCSDSGDSPTNGSNNGGTTEPTFTNVNSLLQSTGCASSSCHGGSSPAGKFSTANYSSIVDSAGNNGIAVTSGDGANSNLYRKVTNNPPFGSRMPISGDTLTTAQQQLIKDWIDQGALDN